MNKTAVRGKASPTVEEAHLGRAASAGDGSAFAVLYERYEQRVFNLAHRITGSEADAADAVQAAFLDAMRRLRLAEQELAFGPCLLTATRSACHDLMGKRPSGTIAEPQQGDDVREASMRLPERQREVLALRDLEELSYEEIAAIMEVNGHTVAQLISRARINLRDEMRGTALASVAAPSAECERALPLIASRDDGQLEADGRDAAWLDSHLAGCHRCRLAVEAMREADASYRGWAPIAAMPWLLGETMAKAAELAGADWSEEIAAATASRAPAESPGTPSAYATDGGRGRPARRRLTLLAGLAALLLLAGVAAVLARNDPPATPAAPAADAAPGPRAGGPEAGPRHAKAGRAREGVRKKGVRRKRAETRTTAAADTLAGPATAAAESTPAQAPTGSGGASRPASHPSGSGGAAAVQPTHQTQTSAPKHSSEPSATTPAPQAAPATATTPAPAPAAEEPPPAEEATTEKSHGREPPGKPADRPPH